jgi:hypothetical protein
MKLKEFQLMPSSKSSVAPRFKDIKLIESILNNIDSMMKTDSSKIKSQKTPATKTPKK